MENQRIFLDKAANELKIKEPSDWGKISVKSMYEKGGGTLLSKYYNNSLLSCLRSVYNGFTIHFFNTNLQRYKLEKRMVF